MLLYGFKLQNNNATPSGFRFFFAVKFYNNVTASRLGFLFIQNFRAEIKVIISSEKSAVQTMRACTPPKGEPTRHVIFNRF